MEELMEREPVEREVVRESKREHTQREKELDLIVTTTTKVKAVAKKKKSRRPKRRRRRSRPPPPPIYGPPREPLRYSEPHVHWRSIPMHRPWLWRHPKTHGRPERYGRPETPEWKDWSSRGSRPSYNAPYMYDHGPSWEI